MGKPTEERKAEIVQGALELAAEHGVKKVTTQAIADRVGIAQPTIFRHFKSRDAIFSAAINWVADGLFAALDGLFTAKAPADERLQQIITRQLAFVSRQRGVPRLLFSDRLHSESPKLKAVVRKIMDRYTSRMSALLAEGIESGHFRSDLDTEASARYIIALIQGLIARWSIFDFEFPLDAQAEPLWRFLWPLLAPPD